MLLHMQLRIVKLISKFFIQYRLTGKWEEHSRFTDSAPFFTPEYWLGWTLAEYQWITKRTFKDIVKYLS